MKGNGHGKVDNKMKKKKKMTSKIKTFRREAQTMAAVLNSWFYSTTKKLRLTNISPH